MDMTHLRRLLPTLEIIAEGFSLAGWDAQLFIQSPQQHYRNVRLFTGRQELLPDVLYTLRPGETGFPTDRFAYICTTPIDGEANHLYCPGLSPEEVLDALLELFSRYQQQEILIDQLTYRNASLQELCQLAEELLENPVCIHDDWFIVIGMSQSAGQRMPPEYLTTSTKGFIPRAILDDFKNDSTYLETYTYPDAQIWESDVGNSLYVNLWDGSLYRGRLLVLQDRRGFRKSDFLLAEVLTQRAILLLQKKQPGDPVQYRSLDDAIFSLLTGAPLDVSDLAQLLNMLGWNKSDTYLCLRLRSRQANANTVTEHMLHSDLFRIFPGSYIFLSGHEQCVIINLRQFPVTDTQLRSRLSPLCQDYSLYAGISAPFPGIRELHLAYYQAGFALEQAFRIQSSRWIIPFPECALAHLLQETKSPLLPIHMVSPGLTILKKHDTEKGTQYFETLREYLLQERDIPRTSQTLIIHRTTLLYRLKKIQELIRINLDDPWERLYLVFSLWILEQNTGNYPGEKTQ